MNFYSAKALGNSDSLPYVSFFLENGVFPNDSIINEFLDKEF